MIFKTRLEKALKKQVDILSTFSKAQKDLSENTVVLLEEHSTLESVKLSIKSKQDLIMKTVEQNQVVKNNLDKFLGKSLDK